MLKVTFLEDPDIDDTAVSFMLSGEEVESLDMTCRGGESCCGRESNRQCGEGEGDCDEDEQCQGLLQCGTDNCQTKTGGAWDRTDDCCQEIYPLPPLYHWDKRAFVEVSKCLNA